MVNGENLCRLVFIPLFHTPRTTTRGARERFLPFLLNPHRPVAATVTVAIGARLLLCCCYPRRPVHLSPTRRTRRTRRRTPATPATPATVADAGNATAPAVDQAVDRVVPRGEGLERGHTRRLYEPHVIPHRRSVPAVVLAGIQETTVRDTTVSSCNRGSCVRSVPDVATDRSRHVYCIRHSA